MTLYKAVRPDGTSFHDPTFRWVPATGDPVGTVVAYPHFSATGTADGYLSVSTKPADCTGVSWPCRLLTVEPIGDMWPDRRARIFPHKRVGAAFRVTGERPAHEALGPNGQQVAVFLALLPTLTDGQWDAAWAAGRPSLVAGWRTARLTARNAARDAARDAAWDAAARALVVDGGGVAQDAALALIVRDLIALEHFAILTAPMRAAGVDFDDLTGDPS